MTGTWALRELYEFTHSLDGDAPAPKSWANFVTGAGRLVIDGVAWYRGSLTGSAPLTLSIWDKASQSRLWKTDEAPDDGNVGWQELDLTGSEIIVVGQNFQVGLGAYGVTGVSVSQYETAGVNFASEAPVAVRFPSSYEANNAGDVFPTNVVSSRYYLLDLRVRQELSTGGVSSADVDAVVASYLTTAGSNYTGNPLADVKNVVENTFNEISDVGHGLVEITNKLTTLVNRLTQDYVDAVLQMTQDFIAFNTRWSQALADLLATAGQYVIDLVADVLECYGGVPGALLCAIKSVAGWFFNPPQVGDTRMVLVDETDYTTGLAWPVQADVYVLNVTTIPPARRETEVAGVDTRYRLGWWTTLNGEFSGQRNYIDFPKALLQTPNGIRMPGLLLNTGPGSAGHVQAYVQVEEAP